MDQLSIVYIFLGSESRNKYFYYKQTETQANKGQPTPLKKNPNKLSAAEDEDGGEKVFIMLPNY